MHSPSDAARDHASANLILAGDSLHNLLDGVLVAAAFMTDPNLGIVTALAVFAHEIPQEVGDLAILLHGGFSRGRAMTLNLVSSLTSVVGGVARVLTRSARRWALLPYALAFAAASFIYVAVADLIPGLHRRVDVRAGLGADRVHRPGRRARVFHAPGHALRKRIGARDRGQPQALYFRASGPTIGGHPRAQSGTSSSCAWTN